VLLGGEGWIGIGVFERARVELVHVTRWPPQILLGDGVIDSGQIMIVAGEVPAQTVVDRQL
jgi:hypothetical protein